MRYRKKPVVVEAVKYDKEHVGKALDFCGVMIYNYNNNEYYIDTLEGRMLLTDGDYIIKGVEGEFYPCKPDIFKKTYEPVEDAGEFVDEGNGYHRVNGFDLSFINTKPHKGMTKAFNQLGRMMKRNE